MDVTCGPQRKEPDRKQVRERRKGMAHTISPKVGDPPGGGGVLWRNGYVIVVRGGECKHSVSAKKLVPLQKKAQTISRIITVKILCTKWVFEAKSLWYN